VEVVHGYVAPAYTLWAGAVGEPAAPHRSLGVAPHGGVPPAQHAKLTPLCAHPLRVCLVTGASLYEFS
jgi:hypothetical protein